MKLYIQHQDSYSRGQLLLRFFFGFFYIGLPYFFTAILFLMWGGILNFISMVIVIFTGEYPENFFNYRVKLLNWSLRVNASLGNLVDGYPAFGINAVPTNVWFTVERLPKYSRGMAIVKLFFGFIMILPHIICLYGRLILDAIYSFIAFWIVLFTGKYPESMHAFRVGTIRWTLRLSLYTSLMTEGYPPFSGKE